MRRKISVITAGCLLVSMISVPAPAKTVKPLKTYHLKQESVDVVQDGKTCVKLQLLKGKKRVKFTRKTKTEKLSTSFTVTFRNAENGTVSVSKQGLVTATAKRYATIEESVGEVTATVTLKKKNKKKWKTYKKKMVVGIYVGDGHIPPTEKPERTPVTDPTPTPDYWAGFPDWMRPGYVPTPAPTKEPTPTPAPTKEPTPRPARTPKPTPTPRPQCEIISDQWIQKVPGVYNHNHQLLYTWDELVDMGKVEVEGSTFTKLNFGREDGEDKNTYSITDYHREKKEWDCEFCHKHHAEYFHSLIIPDTITKIGDCAFDGCNAYGDDSHSEVETWLSRQWSFDDFKFQDEIILPDHLEEIGEYAFRKCDIFAIKIPDGVKKISAHAFEQSLVRQVKLPDHLEEIGDHAFAGCFLLYSAVLPKTVKKIGTDAFACPKLGRVSTVYGDRTFMYEEEVKACRNLDLSEVEEIGAGAFCGANIRNVKWSDTIKVIPAGCFDNLESIEIPEGVTTIEWGALSSYRLKKLKIPSSVTKIGSQQWSEFPEIEYDGPGKWYSEVENEGTEDEYTSYWLE